MSQQTRIAELFGHSTATSQNWSKLATAQRCPFVDKKCFKIRKSDAETSIGTCIVRFNREYRPLIICPNRLLGGGGQVFTDSMHLLTNHEPGNQLHVVPEVSIPGGIVDYFLVSAKGGKAVDFVGIEFQALDTTGTVWPHRQEFLSSVGVAAVPATPKGLGVNWKMTAKTILVQLHHKIEAFEAVNRRLVLVLQKDLMDYMTREFSFGRLRNSTLGDSMQFHPYALKEASDELELVLGTRMSTDAAGVGEALDLGQSGNIDLDGILSKLDAKMSSATRWHPASP